MEQAQGEDQTQEIQTSPHSVFSLWLNRVGAVLIVAGILGAALAIFSTHNTPPARAIGAPFTRTAQAGGLSFVMQITPGPYFLGEMLEADLSLTNDSLITYTLGGPVVDSLCGAAVFVDMSGGTGPHYVLPVPDIPACPFTTSKLAPGETIALHEFLPVSSTGTVILQSGADFLQTAVGPDGSQSTTTSKSPLDGLWPSITISVAAVAPADRRITLQREGRQMQINAPQAALAHLYYLDTATCNSLKGGTVGVETAAWQPISGTILHEPNCGDYGSQAIQWSYVVSAPGYSIAFDASRQ